MGSTRITRITATSRPSWPNNCPCQDVIPDFTTASTAAAGEKYDFYEMLPNFEVVVPEKDKDVKRDLPATAKVQRQGVYVLRTE